MMRVVARPTVRFCAWVLSASLLSVCGGETEMIQGLPRPIPEPPSAYELTDEGPGAFFVYRLQPVDGMSPNESVYELYRFFEERMKNEGWTLFEGVPRVPKQLVGRDGALAVSYWERPAQAEKEIVVLSFSEGIEGSPLGMTVEFCLPPTVTQCIASLQVEVPSRSTALASFSA